VSDDSVGPIIFGDTVAREQLLRGEVISFRSQRRTTRETWARWSRTGEKQADVRVRELTAIHALREDDWGEPLGRFGVKSGESMFLVSSALQKAVRRSDEQLAAYAVWELVRSGYHNHAWKRMRVMLLEDILSDDQVALLIHRYEQLAEEFGKRSWEGKLAAIEAAMALARADSSREGAWARRWFETVAEERVKEDADEQYQFPAIPDEAEDQHTREGSERGRDTEHFVLHASRVTDESDLGKQWKRKSIEHEELADDPDQVEQAVSNVEPGEHDDPPEDPNQSLSEIEDK